MIEIKGIIKNGQIEITSRSREALKQNEGKGLIITLDDRESWEKRKYFEGAVTQFFFYQNPLSGWKDFRQAREILKLEFNGEWLNDKNGKQVRVSKTSKMSNAKFTEFLANIQDYFMQNGLIWPDSEDYLKWIDTVPTADEIYPPLKAIIEDYENLKANPLPKWRQQNNK